MIEQTTGLMIEIANDISDLRRDRIHWKDHSPETGGKSSSDSGFGPQPRQGKEIVRESFCRNRSGGYFSDGVAP